MTSDTAPSPTGARAAARARAVLTGAWRQTLIELRIQLMSPMLLSWVVMPVLGLVALHFLRDVEVMGSAVSIAQLGLPGILTATLVTSGLLGIAGQLITEREDGTLLRCKTVPGGVSSRLLGDVFVCMGTAIGPMVVLLVAGMLLSYVAPVSASSWWTLLWVSVLGLAATLPVGALIGALLRNAMLMWIPGMGLYGLLAISGVFYPLTALPGWLQVVGQVLPVYWIGVGMRHAVLPPEAVALEIGRSWQVWESVAVLGVWSVVGLVLAPIALRRMARRQSGSQVAAARERVLSRGY